MKKYIPTFLLLGWIALILFLSFQKGPDTANTSFTFTQDLLRIFMREEPDYETLMFWDSHFRLAAHFVLFFLYGILSVLVVKEYGKKFFSAFMIGTISGFLLAAISEVGKIPIAGRHCDLSEMGLNLLGVLVGTVCVTVVRTLYHDQKRKKIE